MTNQLSAVELFEYYLSLGIDSVIEPKPVKRRGKQVESLNIVKPQQLHKNKTESSCAPDLSHIYSIEALKAYVEAFSGCPLKDTAINTVFSDGNPEASIMLIGEAPGADEDIQGKPFVGLSGQLLDKIMGSIGLTRDKNIYISNIIPWRPPANRQPSNDEVRICLPFIKKHIELVKPKIIVFVGGTAAKALTDSPDGITKMRGKFTEYQITENFSALGFAIYHPAYLLRSPGQKKVVWHDMLKLQTKVQELNITI